MPIDKLPNERDRIEEEVYALLRPEEEPSRLRRPALLDGGPPVDQELLRGLADRSLPEEQTLEICRLVATFRSWSDGLRSVMTEQTERIASYEKLNGQSD
jgi:hypothetical protein